MAWRPFQKIASGLRHFWEDVTRSQSRRTPGKPTEPVRTPEYVPPRRAPIESEPTYQEREDLSDDDAMRERAIVQVRGFHFEHYNEPRLRRQLYDADIINSWAIIGIDKEGYRQLAATNPQVFGYH
jgi:hypothetical protein